MTCFATTRCCCFLVIFVAMAEVRDAAYLRSSEIMNNNAVGGEHGGGGAGGYDRYGTTNGNAVGAGGRRQGKFYEDLFKSKAAAPPSQPKSPPQARNALGEKQMCMAKFNLGERSLDDKYVGVLRHEVGKLQELVDVLRTQQKIMKDLSEVEADGYGVYYDYGKPKEDEPEEQKAVADREGFAKLCEEVRSLKAALKSMKLVPDEQKLTDEVKVQNEQIGRLKQLLSQLNADGARQNAMPAGNKKNVTDILSKLDDIENRLSKYAPQPKTDEIVGNSFNESYNMGARASSSSGSSLDSLFDLLNDDDAGDSSSSSSTIDVSKFLSAVGKEEKATKSDPDSDIETKLLELQKKLAKQKQLEKLEKQIKESRGLSVSSHSKDESAQMKRLEKMLKKLSKAESKTTDDDDVELNLKSLEKAIKNLQPKEEDEDEDEEEEEVDVSALLEKMIPKKKKKKKTKLTQSALKKLLKGGKGEAAGYDNDDYFDKYGFNGLSEISFDGPANVYQPPGYGGYGGYGGYQPPDDYYPYHYPDKNYRFFHKPPSYGSSDPYYSYYHKVDPYDGKPDSFFHYDRKFDADAGHRPVRGGYPKAGPAGQYNPSELYPDPTANHGDYRTLEDLKSQIYGLQSALGAYTKPDDTYAVDDYKPPTSYDPKNDIPSGQQATSYGDAGGQEAGYAQRKTARMFGDVGPSARSSSKSRQSANQQLVDMLSTFGESTRSKRDASPGLAEAAADLLNKLLDQANPAPRAPSHPFTLEDLKDKINALHNQS